MRKLTWALMILIVATWAVIAVYWIGTEKNQSASEETSDNVVTLSPTTVPLATDSGNTATMSSPTIKVTTSKVTFESSSSSVLLTSPTIIVQY